jgi:prepilin-type N-terminal cleavage/methylation domain-containing protein
MKFQSFKTYRNHQNRMKPLLSCGMRGFTLLEMAIVLAIIGLVMGTLLTMTKTLTTSSKIAATQSKEALIKAALINFIATNNRLPCPGDPSPTVLSGISAGSEAITSGVCNATGLIHNSTFGTVVTGVVPWIQLGLSQEAATDGYNQLFSYQVTLSATTTVAATSVTASGQRTISGLRGDISLFSATPPVAATSLTALGNQINYCTPANFSVNPCAAVAIIVSHGEDLIGAFTLGGQTQPTTADELENANNDSYFVKHDFSINSANPFNDIILPLSVNDLLSSLSTNGTVQNFNAVINSNIATIISAVTNYSIANATGIPGNRTLHLPASLAVLSLPQSVINDPWGMPYVYTLTTSSLTNLTSPATVLYSLQSDGPDKIPANADDLPTSSGVSITVSQFQSSVPLASGFW